MEAGEWTLLLRLNALSSAPDQSGILGALYAGAPTSSWPYWSGSDVWPVKPESLDNGDINQPKMVFPASYVAGGTWVSGPPAALTLTLGMSGYEPTLLLQRAVISMYVYGTGATAYATKGTIAVIETEQLVAELKKVAGLSDPSLCSSTAFEGIATQIRQASDIMADGTNGDPSKTCNAISIGLGFEAFAAVLGGVAPPEASSPDPCAP
jgi:hypothetical protein